MAETEMELLPPEVTITAPGNALTARADLGDFGTSKDCSSSSLSLSASDSNRELTALFVPPSVNNNSPLAAVVAVMDLIPVKVSIGAVRPPITTVEKITTDNVVVTNKS